MARGCMQNGDSRPTAINDAPDTLVSAGYAPRRSGCGWVVRCPAHDERQPSLAVIGRDGRVLLKYWAGCGTGVVLRSLGTLK